ncbi:MAG: hypothetical protein IJ193_05250 [Bacilli bacterium]|nr:hypothetical protein [Bacilli bacterium]
MNGKKYFYYYGVYRTEAAEEAYEVTEGGNTTLSSDDSGDLTLTTNSEAELKQVIVDNEVLHSGYTAEGTKVTFTNDYLKSLSAGTYDVIITYSDGKSAYTTLTIQEATTEEPSEDTSTTTPVATATSNSVVSNSYTSVIVDSLADDEEEKEDEVATKEDKKDDKKKKDKPEKESLTKTNSTFYIILVIIFLIIIAVPFVIDRKKQ